MHLHASACCLVLVGELTGCATSRQAGPRAATDFDVSTLPLFWELHDQLRRGVDPPDSVWSAFWNAPAYALLEVKEQRRTTLTRALRLAYMPGQQAAADSILRGNAGWLGRAVSHLRAVTTARDTLLAFERALAASDLMERGRRRAQMYLPDGTVEAHPAPRVSFVYFLDARGYPERILLDPLYFMRLRNPVDVLSHEYHHYYRSRIARPQRPYGNDLLAWTLSTVESEGLAGMLDKRDVPTMTRAKLDSVYGGRPSHAYFVEYQTEYRRSHERLRQAEGILERVAEHRDSAGVLGAWLHRELPDNGRIVGAFMSEVIERHLGRARLVSVVGDPFAFWRLYNEAAGRSRGAAYVLSDAAMRTIGEVEARYRFPR